MSAAPRSAFRAGAVRCGAARPSENTGTETTQSRCRTVLATGVAIWARSCATRPARTHLTLPFATANPQPGSLSEEAEKGEGRRSVRNSDLVGKAERPFSPLLTDGGRWRGRIGGWRKESEYVAERSTRRSLHSCRGADQVHADYSCSIAQCRQVVGVYGNVSVSR